MNQNYLTVDYSNSLNMTNLKDILISEKFNNIVVVATTDNNEVVGVYDPNMFYYEGSSKVTLLGKYRYFSMNDYVQSNNVALNINSCDFFNIEDNVGISKSGEETINCIYPYAFENTNIIKMRNLFALDQQDIFKLYVDSNDSKVLDEVKNRFEELNIRVTSEVVEEPSIIVSLVSALMAGKYQKFLLYSVLGIATLYLVVLYVFIKTKSKEIQIHKIVGATMLRIYRNVYLSTIFAQIVVGAIADLSTNIYLRFIHQYQLSIASLIEIISIMIMMSCIVVFFGLKKIKKR